MNRIHRFLLSAIAVVSTASFALDIVKDGKSDFVIYHAQEAPDSVIEGAKDLQTYCEKVTGVKLPISTLPRPG